MTWLLDRTRKVGDAKMVRPGSGAAGNGAGGLAVGAPRGVILSVALFVLFVNMLMLTGPLFMLQVYDRVLPSRSAPTLVALVLVMALAYAALGLLEAVRARIGARLGAALQMRLDAQVFRAVLSAPPSLAAAATAPADIESVRRFFASPLAFSLLDLPFVPLFAAAVFLFHPDLGWLALGGGAGLLVLMMLNQAFGRRLTAAASDALATVARRQEQFRLQADTLRGLGIVGAATRRWQRGRLTALAAELRLAGLNGGFGTAVRTFRQFLQSLMLALSAWLVIRGEMTPGGMIAASILMTRALQPVEQLVAGWAMVAQARAGWRSLSALLAAMPGERPRTALPSPQARLQVRDLAICPPGTDRPTLRGLTFSLAPGQVLGLIGDSGAGKSSLVRALAGVWPAASGELRLDGARLDDYDEAALAAAIGYLPQDVVLFDGTVAENIGGLADPPDGAACVAAAMAAGAHQTILDLPFGYDTPVGAGGARLSGGQRQRIGLARALFGAPELLILDEPATFLDPAGVAALTEAVRGHRARGGAVILTAHRTSALADCDLLLHLAGGTQAAFGPREQVLQRFAAAPRLVGAGLARAEGRG